MELLKNNSSTTLNGAINNSVTSVVVTDGSVFSATGNFRVIVENEIMLVTSRSSNTLTVTRGAEGTTAASHADLISISHSFTKGNVEQILFDYNQLGGYASRPSTARKGATYQSTDFLDTKWMFDGTNWNLIYPAIVPYAKRVNFSGWTADNHGLSVFTNKGGVLDANLDKAVTMRVYYKTRPTAPYKHTIVIPRMFFGATVEYFVGVRENSTGKLRVLNAEGSGQWRYEAWTTSTSGRGVVTNYKDMSFNAPTWFRFEDNNTNWILQASRNGIDYYQLYSEARNTGFTADQICVGFVNAYSIIAANPPINLQLLGQWEE